MRANYKYQALIIVFLSFCNILVFSQVISTRGEIYNFEIGDIFHYQKTGNYGWGQSGFWRKINDSIADKYTSANNDTIFYVVKRNTAEISEWNQYWTYDTISFLRTIYNLDSLINGGNIDTVYTHPNAYHNRKINFLQYYVATPYDSTTYKKKWVNGCGFVWDIYIDHTWGNTEEFLLEYYKKGNEEWGTPIIIVDTKETLYDSFKVFPNPAKKEFYIESPKWKTELKYLEIYSLNGRLLKYQKLENKSKSKVDIKDLKEGLYIINIVLENGIHQSKLIKE